MVKTVTEIARLLHGQVVGDGATQVSGVSGIVEAKPGEITFLAAPRYRRFLKSTAASAVIVPRDTEFPQKTLIRVAHPRLAFAKVMRLFYPLHPEVPEGIHPSAVIGQKVHMGRGVSIGACTYIQERVTIGDNAIIFPGVIIGRKSQIGSGSIIYANVTIREDTIIGKNVIVHSGTVIGSDGFGYAKEGHRHLKIPQKGIVIIEDDVEIGANVTIDRGTLGATRIGRGTKIDNLVQIAHNVVIGPHSLLMAQVGISGSTEIGSGVILTGQVGVVGHIKIGDESVVGAQSGVSKSVPPRSVLFGYPARPIQKTKRIEACLSRLPDLFKRVSVLEKGLNLLKRKWNDRSSKDH
jgi:UDP-3-O-[3-hydroxymyristoyl] glucosamine N-acyltransferase